MVDDQTLESWFRSEVLILERSLTAFIRSNWRTAAEVIDLRQEIYERALIGARGGLPAHTRAYLYTVARNHLINRAKRGQIVSFDLVSDLERDIFDGRHFSADAQLSARDELRRAQAGLDLLPSRCREVVWLRKVEGLSTAEAAQRMGVTVHTIEKQLTEGMRALTDFMLGGSGRVRRTDMRAARKARRR